MKFTATFMLVVSIRSNRFIVIQTSPTKFCPTIDTCVGTDWESAKDSIGNRDRSGVTTVSDPWPEA